MRRVDPGSLLLTGEDVVLRCNPGNMCVISVCAPVWRAVTVFMRSALSASR